MPQGCRNPPPRRAAGLPQVCRKDLENRLHVGFENKTGPCHALKHSWFRCAAGFAASFAAGVASVLQHFGGVARLPQNCHRVAARLLRMQVFIGMDANVTGGILGFFAHVGGTATSTSLSSLYTPSQFLSLALGWDDLQCTMAMEKLLTYLLLPDGCCVPKHVRPRRRMSAFYVQF